MLCDRRERWVVSQAFAIDTRVTELEVRGLTFGAGNRIASREKVNCASRSLERPDAADCLVHRRMGNGRGY